MTDPVSDFLTRLRNASKAGLAECVSPHSKLKESLAGILDHPDAAPVVRWQFSGPIFDDDPATIPQADIVDFCNGDSYTGYGNNGSVKKYFRDNSNGTLTYSNVVFGGVILLWVFNSLANVIRGTGNMLDAFKKS